MPGIIDYLEWRGDLFFSQDQFNRADSAVLCAVSYFPFELIDFYNGITIADAVKKLLDIPNINNKVLFKHDIPLMNKLKNSQRFSNLELYDFESIIDTQSQTQFSAVTIKLERGLYCVIFRGTDDSLVGWKEDLNMSFVCPVPAQRHAVEYFEKIAPLRHGKFIVAGHSKGGNLAIYSSALCKSKLQKRIISVFSHDAPGFNKEVLQSQGYKNICRKILRFVPQSSIIGMLLEHTENYIIVRSDAITPLQHSLYTWQITGNNFCLAEEITQTSKFVENTLGEWLVQLDSNKREQFADIVYNILLKTNSDTLGQMSHKRFASATAILKSICSLDKQNRNVLANSLLLLMKSARNNITEIRKKD